MIDDRLNGGVLPITRATVTDAPEVSALIALAFHDLAVARWLVPDSERRAAVLPANFRIIVEHAIAYGMVHLTPQRTAAAVWFPRDSEPLPAPPAYEQQVQAACGEATPRFRHLDELFAEHHPDLPHHHLAFLAVHPSWQRRGLGGALLRRHHSRLDSWGTSAYLEATSERSRDLYRRHGYRVLRGPFRLPDGTPIWPMWRPPRPGALPRQEPGA